MSEENMLPMRRMGGMQRQQPPGNGPTVTLQAAVVGLAGIKADYHKQRHTAKIHRHPLDAGFDLYPSRTTHDVKDLSPSWLMIYVSTGLVTVLGPGSAGLIVSRSSSAVRLCGAEVVTAVIDAHYSGEILIQVKCLKTDLDLVRSAIDKAAAEEVALAQMVVFQYMAAHLTEFDMKHAPSLLRGNAGFGSTDAPKA